MIMVIGYSNEAAPLSRIERDFNVLVVNTELVANDKYVAMHYWCDGYDGTDINDIFKAYLLAGIMYHEVRKPASFYKEDLERYIVIDSIDEWHEAMKTMKKLNVNPLEDIEDD